MNKVLIVGSGASGVHFALSVLKKGYEVTMLDVGYKKPEAVNPDDTLNGLKEKLDDPVKYFLGENYEAVIYPDYGSEYYGFPPSKNYVFSKPPGFGLSLKGFSPVLSFARGGLAEAWTAGVCPFDDVDLADFLFNYNEIEPYYNEVAKRIGVTGERDDLVKFFPFHENLSEPLNLDEHSKLLLSEYEKNKHYLNNKLRCYMGRSRIAVLKDDYEDRKGCSYCGRCLWGCPLRSLYTPSATLYQCQQYDNFKYVPDAYVSHFKYDSKNHITDVVAQSITGGINHEFPIEKLVLAAGTLCSSEIYLNSVFKNTGEIIKLRGLMDNRQIFIPFVNLNMIGKQFNPENYQYHQLSMELERENPKEYIDIQLTTLKTAMIHPLIQSMFFDLKTSLSIFGNIHSALGLASVSFFDSRRTENYLTLETDDKTSRLRLGINYSSMCVEDKEIKKVLKKITKALRKLGCIAPSAANHIRPMGANIHYAGTIPMSLERTQNTLSKDCQSHDFDNLYIVDGTSFPWLPAKNLTFTLMANAVRVSENAF
ncbi:MAG: GMC oxidoreductase [Thermodesulfovibrionia bacterium]|nr:GMC oxidoreductase [Thermodesulfovibrionia bacterium]